VEKGRHVVITVRGEVQGVSFRAEARDKALRLGLAGWVSNEADGSVTIVAEGSDGAVAQMVDWCRSGPELARVMSVAVTEAPWEGLKDFVIRR